MVQEILKSGVDIWKTPLENNSSKEFDFSPEAQKQREIFNKLADDYFKARNLPHTQEYFNFLIDSFLEPLQKLKFGSVVELCCGQAEGLFRLSGQYNLGVGIDVSESMLKIAESRLQNLPVKLIHCSVMDLPFKDQSIDCVVVIGGIHHIPDRKKLFIEVSRVLKTGGKFVWIDPVSDFPLWKMIRKFIYSRSVHFDPKNEAPLEKDIFIDDLKPSQLELNSWKYVGFLGFILFMNPEILKFNKAFKYIPGIKYIVRFVIRLDSLILKIPFLSSMGLQVCGVAKKV